LPPARAATNSHEAHLCTVARAKDAPKAASTRTLPTAKGHTRSKVGVAKLPVYSSRAKTAGLPSQASDGSPLRFPWIGKPAPGTRLVWPLPFRRAANVPCPSTQGGHREAFVGWTAVPICSVALRLFFSRVGTARTPCASSGAQGSTGSLRVTEPAACTPRGCRGIPHERGRPDAHDRCALEQPLQRMILSLPIRDPPHPQNLASPPHPLQSGVIDS